MNKEIKFNKSKFLNSNMESLKYFSFILLLVFSFNFVVGETYKAGEITNLQFICTVDNQIPSAGATYNFSIYFPNGTSLFNNQLAQANGQGSFNYTLTFPDSGTYKIKSFCYDTLGNFSSEDFLEVTPTGKIIQDVGQISVGILYLFIIIGFGLVFLGYLFLNSDSLWVSYGGLFMMILGFAFVYYDLHLSNLYASTIALNSGAENVTSGAFVMIAKFLKLAPLIVAGIIAFSSVRVLKEAIKKKKSSDGWDGNKY